MKHVICVIAREAAHSLEFFVEPRRRILSVSFWGRKQLICMQIAFCGNDVLLSRSFVELTSQLLNVNGGDATITCCGGSNVDFIKALEKSPGCKTGIQYPFGLFSLQFEQLLHKPSFSLMGKIKKLSRLPTLLPCLRRLLDERWVQSTQFFRRINMSCKVPIFLVDLDVKR